MKRRDALAQLSTVRYLGSRFFTLFHNGLFFRRCQAPVPMRFGTWQSGAEFTFLAAFGPTRRAADSEYLLLRNLHAPSWIFVRQETGQFWPLTRLFM